MKKPPGPSSSALHLPIPRYPRARTGIPKTCAGFSQRIQAFTQDREWDPNPALPSWLRFPLQTALGEPGGTGSRAPGPELPRGAFPFPTCTAKGGDSFPPVDFVWEARQPRPELKLFQHLNLVPHRNHHLEQRFCVALSPQTPPGAPLSRTRRSGADASSPGLAKAGSSLIPPRPRQTLMLSPGFHHKSWLAPSPKHGPLWLCAEQGLGFWDGWGDAEGQDSV